MKYSNPAYHAPAKTPLAKHLLIGTAFTAIAANIGYAQSLSDEIIVTAQRTEQSLQDVPIAVSAFSGDDIADRQLESFTDIQFNTPNFAFSRTQFTTSTISIRGIGALAVAASSEPSTSIHVNEVYISSPRLFETEFFDIERLEILRGPQGTLFGRNATGGVINVVTAKANPDEAEAYIDVEYGDYDSLKLQGAVNAPLTETLAARFAGTWIKRDGYTENLYTGEDIDDRDIYALRFSTRWLPTENTTVDVTVSHMREDDNRARSQKQACADGPLKTLLGCQPGIPRDYGIASDLRSTFFAGVSQETYSALFLDLGASPEEAAALGQAYGLFSIADPDFDVDGEDRPTDLRQVYMDTSPQYEADETVVLLNAKHDFETFSVKINAGWGQSTIDTLVDFDAGVGPELTPPPGVFLIPALERVYGDGTFLLSDFDTGMFDDPDGFVGSIGGNTKDASNRFMAVDRSVGESEYWSVEGIVASDFDGRLNFLLGASYGERTSQADYGTATNAFDYFTRTIGTLAVLSGLEAAAQEAALAGQIDLAQALAAQAAEAAETGYSAYTPYFYNDSEDVSLETLAFFGEVYFDITDTLRLTGGVRHNRDSKGSRERQVLLASLGDGVETPFVPFGTLSVADLLDSDPETEGTPGAVADFIVNEGDFNATTGRGVLQWTPTPTQQYYVSYTRGYKPGGFNPRSDILDIVQTYGAETIDAIEIGAKTNLFDGVVQANLTGFYYDYGGLQISRIVANSSINDNVDATSWGLEGEFVVRPTDRLTLNLSASYLNTQIGDVTLVDQRNPTQFEEGVDLFLDLTNGSNCVIDNNGAPSLVGAVIPSNFFFCSALGDVVAAVNAGSGGATNYEVLPDGGVPVSVEGNRLPGSPEFQLAGGVQYEFDLGKFTLTPRLDAYYQTEFYSNLFNTDADLIDGYAYLNGQVRFEPKEGAWYLRVFMQNITDEDAITGQFDVGQGAGNWTNVFLLEPKRWGVGFGMKF